MTCHHTNKLRSHLPLFSFRTQHAFPKFGLHVHAQTTTLVPLQLTEDTENMTCSHQEISNTSSATRSNPAHYCTTCTMLQLTTLLPLLQAGFQPVNIAGFLPLLQAPQTSNTLGVVPTPVHNVLPLGGEHRVKQVGWDFPAPHSIS